MLLTSLKLFLISMNKHWAKLTDGERENFAPDVISRTTTKLAVQALLVWTWTIVARARNTQKAKMRSRNYESLSKISRRKKLEHQKSFSHSSLPRNAQSIAFLRLCVPDWGGKTKAVMSTGFLLTWYSWRKFSKIRFQLIPREIGKCRSLLSVTGEVFRA